MRKWNLKITLKSDLCAATGEDVPGITNIKTATEYGVPYIPAKRIKGCLVEAGREMRDNGLVEQKMLEQLFGRSGAAQTESIHIGDARLCYIPDYFFETEPKKQITSEVYERFQREVQTCSEAEQAYLEEFFTRYRTRTAIDMESGTACKHTLRTMQVVPAKVAFVSLIEGELEADGEEILLRCVKGLRHMGVGITRGLGEVQCELTEVLSEEAEHVLDDPIERFQDYKAEDEVVLSYEIDLDSPVVIEGEGDCLPASAVQGALAGMYIRKHSLGEHAHKDETFNRIFLHDGIKFGYSFLKRNNKTYLPCPKAIARMKEEKDRWFHIGRDKKGVRRKEISGQICWEGTKLEVASSHKEIHFHHARPVNRGIGHALNDRVRDNRIPMGEFFQYIALSKGQTYAGTWIGKAADIKCLVECLEASNYRLRLGKSKTAEYGNCSFKIENVSLKKKQKECQTSGTQWMMWLLTPMVQRERESGLCTLDEAPFKAQLEEKLECKVLELRKVACSYTTISGYNSRWRLPSAPQPAVAPGSTYFIKTDKAIQLHELEGYRWGENTGRGYGQVAAKLWETIQEGEILVDVTKEIQMNKEEGGILFDILRFREKQLQCASTSIEALNQISKEDLPPSSAIALLIQLLRQHAASQNFYNEIKEEVNRIQKEDKKEKILELIARCDGASYEFMKIYLENAKWKARLRERNEG